MDVEGDKGVKNIITNDELGRRLQNNNDCIYGLHVLLVWKLGPIFYLKSAILAFKFFSRFNY